MADSLPPGDTSSLPNNPLRSAFLGLASALRGHVLLTRLNAESHRLGRSSLREAANDPPSLLELQDAICRIARL